MTLLTLSLGLLTTVAPLQEPTAPESPFPASSALAEGVSPKALDDLNHLVQSLVDDEEIVGAELMVIKNGHTILHEAYGWNDRGAESPMSTGSVFCVRSMTKPLIGTAILMLVDDNVIDLDDPVHKYLPAFDVEGSRDITIEHLITHTSGLPMSLLLGKDLKTLDGIQAVAELGAGYDLAFTPGSDISYSDQGTDTLTAVIEVVSGKTAADFVRTRILEPLGMQDTATVMSEDHPLRSRGVSKYLGTRANWTRFWSPEEPPLFPFFLGSQGLYSTLEDYARFMEFWRNKGKVGRERLLGSRYMRKALAPSPFGFQSPTGLPAAAPSYGFLMQLWPSTDENNDDLIAFGHTGSDGTHAWVFPEQKAMVLYFTQSRQNTTGLRVEEALGQLFLGAPFNANEAAPPLDQYLGYYWEHEDDLYRAIVRDGEDLALEILGKAVVPLTYIGEDSWKFRPNPSVVLEFQRSPEGAVTGYRIGDHEEFRFEPSADLPSAEEMAARVAQAHRLDLLESIGPLRLHSTLTMEKLGMEGDVQTLLAWPGHFRYESTVANQFERVAYNGEQVWYESALKPLAVLDGKRAAFTRVDSPFARFGDWSRWYPSFEVVQQLQRKGRTVILVRMGNCSAPATTLYVDAETGRMIHTDGMAEVEGMGTIGQRVSYGDFRDVSGVLLPYRSEVEIANPIIGTIATQVTEIEVGVELAEGVFELID